MSKDIRNITIIAHVDHGKTTLIDNLMKQSGSFRENEVVDERLMDSGELEKERGITILAKPASINWKDSRINIIDTPGHRDFAAEVERVLSMADGALLLIDSAEGVMPQTKFVLSKALKQGLKPIVVINKLDKSDQRANEVLDETFDLFVSLDANEEQLDFPVLYASGRSGWADKEIDGPRENLNPLLDQIIDHVKPAELDKSKPFAYIISVDGCDEDTLADLMYYGREMLLQDLVRSPISKEAKHDLKTNPKSSLVIENTAEGHASFELFNIIHVLVALMDVPYEKVLYTNSTSNIEECYDQYILNRPYALIEKIKVFGSGEWNEMVCQQMVEDTYNLECQDDYCEWGDVMKDEWYDFMNISRESTKFLNNIHPEYNRPHLFLYKHMNAKRGHRTTFMSLLNDRGLLDGNLFSTPNDWDSTFSSGEKYLRKWYTKKYTIEGTAWYTDQIKLRKYVNKFSKKNKSRIVELDDAEMGFFRFNRNRLEKHFNMIQENPNLEFTDFHMPRPFNEYEELIKKVFEYHRKHIIN